MARIVKPGGIGQYFEDGFWSGKLTEVHSSTCSHCGKITEFPSMRRMMEFVEICRGCMKLICLECADKGCTPFIKKIEQAEREKNHKKALRILGYG